MMRRVLGGIRLFLSVQFRTGFIHVYIAVTVFTVILVRAVFPEAWRETVVPVLLLTEYGVVGVYMIAAQNYLSRNERSNEALRVTPLRATERVFSMVLAATCIALAAALLFVTGLLGPDIRLALLVPPLFASTVLAGSVGLIVSSRYSDFTRFIMGSIPVVAVFSLPLLSYFELVPRYAFVWLPWDAALFSFASIVDSSVQPTTYLLLLLQLSVFAVLALRWAVRSEASA